MAETKQDTVEVGRVPVVEMSRSRYMRIPDFMKRGVDPQRGDQVVFSQRPNNPEVIIHIEKGKV